MDPGHDSPLCNHKELILLGITYPNHRVRAIVITRKRCNSPKENHAMTTRRATDDSKALNAFLAAKHEIDGMLARLAPLSADHFETSPDEIHWGHVGTLNHYRTKLREITDSAFKEGEHAD